MTDNSFSRDQIALAYQTVFEQSSAGIVVLDDLYSKFDDYNGFDPDPYKNAFNAGKREVVRSIQRQLSIAQQKPEVTND